MLVVFVGTDIRMKLYKNKNKFQEIFPHIIEELLNNKTLKNIEITIELKGNKIVKILIKPNKATLVSIEDGHINTDPPQW